MEAYARIRPGVLFTPLIASRWLTDTAHAEGVYLKLESEQHHNAFKCRGALNKVLTLSPQQLAAGIVTSSTGNHAMGVLHAIQWVARATCGGPDGAEVPPPHIFVPATISQYKLSRLQQHGALVKQVLLRAAAMSDTRPVQPRTQNCVCPACCVRCPGRVGLRGGRAGGGTGRQGGRRMLRVALQRFRCAR